MAWQISGQYMETCNCDYLCPCPLTALQETTHGFCTFAMAYRVDRGNFDGTSLDGLSFIVVGHTPGAMSDGNWKVGLIVDERADGAQEQALTAIATGQAGGPVANLAPLFGEFLGVEKRAISFETDGRKASVSSPGRIDQVAEAAISLSGEQMFLDNAGHPAGNRIGLANAKKSHVHAFGIDWDDVSGRNNGHMNPFTWSS